MGEVNVFGALEGSAATVVAAMGWISAIATRAISPFGTEICGKETGTARGVAEREPRLVAGAFVRVVAMGEDGTVPPDTDGGILVCGAKYWSGCAVAGMGAAGGALICCGARYDCAGDDWIGVGAVAPEGTGLPPETAPRPLVSWPTSRAAASI